MILLAMQLLKSTSVLRHGVHLVKRIRYQVFKILKYNFLLFSTTFTSSVSTYKSKFHTQQQLIDINIIFQYSTIFSKARDYVCKKENLAAVVWLRFVEHNCS